MNMKIEKKFLFVQNVCFFFGSLILLLTIGFWSFQCMVKSGEQQLRVPNIYDKFSSAEMNRSSEINLDGKSYVYEEDNINILILGIDGRGEAEKNEFYGFGPRADSIYLAIIKPKSGNIKLLNISRDLVTDIKMFDSLGKDMGNYPMQLGLQYCNGDGLHGSCELMESAVSNLLNNIPIHGYCALYWSGIEKIHESVGPVAVNVPQYLADLDFVTFEKSGMTEIDAEQAKIFVQCRDINLVGSDELRRERQKEYFEALYISVKNTIQKKPFVIWKILKKIDSYMVTDLSKKEILTLAYWMELWDNKKVIIKTIPGETVDGIFQDEYIVDKAGMEELFIKLFYEEKY